MENDTEDTSVLMLFIKDFCRYCTLHGVRYFTIHVRHWSERLWWIVAFGLALWLSSSMIHTFWVDWQEYPMTMATTNEVNALSKIPFPTVIICPQTQIMRNKFDLSSKFDSNDQLLPNVSHTDKMRLLKLVNVCQRLIELLPYGNDFADEDIFNVIRDVAPNVEDITISCSWKGTIVDCSEYLKPILTSEYSMCFTFNGLNSRDVYTDKMAPGLMISKKNPDVSQWTLENGYEGDFKEKEYPVRVTDSDEITTLEIDLVIDKRNDDRLCPSVLQGFTIFLTPPYEQNDLMVDKPIQAKLSSDTHVHVTPKLVTTSSGLRKYSPNRRECFFQSERQLRFYKTYSEKNCHMECWANLTKKLCGCVHLSMPRDRDTKICGNTKYACYLGAISKYDSFEVNKCNCWDACTSTEYPFEIEQFPLKIIDGKPLNESHQRARLTVSLQKDQVKTMQRVETVTIVEFLAMCGGVLGLFIGFSVLSLVELIYYPCLRLFCMIQRLKEDKDEQNDNERPESPTGTSIYVPKRANSRWSARLQNFLIEYCMNSNIHGVRYFVDPNLRWIGRYFWMICCAASLSLCVWITFNVYSQWQSSPMLIKPVKGTQPWTISPFPTVTICPEVKAKRQKFDLTSALNNLSNLSHIETQQLNALASVCPRLPNSVAFEDHFANESIYDTIQDLALQFGDTFGQCIINGEYPARPCAQTMTSILTDEGLCFAFNALNSHEMYTNEMAPGMMVVTGNPNISHWSLENGYELGFHKDEYPTRVPVALTDSIIVLSIDVRNLEYRCKPFDGAFKVILTPPGEVLQMSRNYFRLSLKQINTITFDMKMMKTSEGLRSYAPSERQCFYQSERRLHFFKMYTEANCEAECLANFTSVECGCVHFSMPRDNRTKVCGGASVSCLRAVKRKLLTDESASAFHSECNCLPACVSIEYKALIQHFDTETISKQNVLLFFKPQNVIANERVERWTVVDFLAFFGGVLGSGLGISVLSLFEIIFFVTIRLYWLTRQWRIENTVVHPSNQEPVEVITENTAMHWITRRRRSENTAVYPSNQESIEMVTIEHLDE